MSTKAPGKATLAKPLPSYVGAELAPPVSGFLGSFRPGARVGAWL